ncbi:MAG: tRNA preQ1(34) S-adenosylmethionine ribosyltransferase-isomerase QueA [Spirochaetes bacterium]|nr:tRNA preQ1(34) S-adenosylmethionine ribosyltransferase-isomerase QueA [Spirochaetota bacterium]
MPGNRKYTLDDFNFELPEDLIAQHPAGLREQSRLLVFDRNTGKIDHSFFYKIGEYLKPGDILILNNARVIPARLYFKRQSGGLVEILLNRKLSENKWLAISNRTKRLKSGEVLESNADSDIAFKVISRVGDNLEIESNTELSEEVLLRIGEVPLPPYIKRESGKTDIERYQTVYSETGIAAAAPTAGLHFTDDLLNQLEQTGIVIVRLTLNVSWGTFKPVRDNELEKHQMHIEDFNLPKKTADIINTARDEGRRIIAVGTTSLRVLESTFKNGRNVAGTGETDIFIYPPYNIKSIDAMITNFHTPRSTLLMLVSAFAGYEKIMKLYKTAVEEKYRFFSYGDAMFIS